MSVTVDMELVIPGEPVAQPRQRHSKFGSNYIPKSHPIHDMKALIRLKASEEYKGPLLDSAVRLKADFYFSRNKGQMWKKKPMPRLWHTKKPDGDNLVKAVKDAMTGIVWKDDSIVCDVQYRKFICNGDEKPRIELFVELLAENAIGQSSSSAGSIGEE